MSESQAVEEPIVVVPEADRQEQSDSRSKKKKQPPYAVIVHNDEQHTWPYVIDVLQRVCGHPLERARRLTAQVHFHGKAHVWVGALEIAELKRDQIRGFGKDFYAEKTVDFPLGVTIEPLPGD